MTRRLALTPAIGLFTGLSMVSFGAVSMWLTGVHGAPAANPCTSKTSTQPGRGPAHPAAYAVPGAHVRHPANLPIVLDAAAQRVSGPAATRGTSTSPSPKSSTPAPNPTPGSGGGGGISPGPGGSGPSPSSTSSAVVGPGQKAGGGGTSSVPGGANKPPATHGATPTPTNTATPTPTSTATPPPGGTLCLSVQTLGGSSTVTEGTTVQFAIFVWVTAGKGSTAKLALTSSPSDIAPTFSVCATTGGTGCSISGLKANQQVEVQAKLTAAKDRVGKSITLNISGTSKQAINSATASDQIQVTSKSGSTPTPTPTPTDPGNNNPGNGGTLPPANPGGVGNNSFPGVNQPGNLGSALPAVSPSPGVSPNAPGRHQQQHPLKAIDLSAGLPLDVRLIGGQVIGLAILAAAVTIAVARLSLRRQPGRHGDDNASTDSGSASS
jgi:hypothetical protein